MTISNEDLQNRFSYHAPSGDQPQRYEDIRARVLSVARFIVQNTPMSREQSLAVTHLEDAVMWSNAAIARNEGGDNE